MADLPSIWSPSISKLIYDSCSLLELTKLWSLVKKFGEEITTWPEAETQYLEWLKNDIPLREPRNYLDRKSFWCNHLPGELFVIRYKDTTKKPLFQLEHGYCQEEHPNVIYPDHNKYFVHYDLSEWNADIQFDQLSKEELVQICLQLISKK